MKKILSFIAIAILILSGSVAYAAMPAPLEARINVLESKHDQAEVVWEKINNFLDKAEDHGYDVSEAHDEYEYAKETHTNLLNSIDALKEELSSGEYTPATVSEKIHDLKDSFVEWKTAMKNLVDKIKEIRESIVTE